MPRAAFSLAFISGVLNSTLVNAWFAGHFFSFHITVTQMRQVPIPKSTRKERVRVESVVERILALPVEPGHSEDLFAELDEAVAACFLEKTEVPEAISHAKKLLAKPLGM